jgi:medium-chain acyl-[acyl-carrier-protein] hydrolase
MGFDRNEIVEDAWREMYGIRSYEVDRWGRVPVPVLLNFIQEGASNHADFLKLGFSHLEEIGRFWVLSRISIHVDTYPCWGESVALYTWPAGVDRLFALREFRLTDDRDRVILSASSAWLMLDVRRRRPVRIERLFMERGVTLDREPHGEVIESLPVPGGGEESIAATVQRSDLDLNDHVNNARYVEWVLDSYPEEFVRGHVVSDCTIHFLSESRSGEHLDIQTVRRGDRSFLHSVVRFSDGNEVCRLLLAWRQR